MQLPTITRVFAPLKRNPWGFGLAMASSVLVVISNSSGVGWSWDTSDYVAVGINLSNGNGLLDVTNNPMTVRPPGLSILIALGTWLGPLPRGAC